MPSSPRRRAAPHPPDAARIAAESVHAINNALGLLYGMEYLLEPSPGQAPSIGADARGCLTDAMRRLGACANALSLLALRPADLRVPGATGPEAVAPALERACLQSGLPLRWTLPAAPARPIALDATLLGWLFACAASALRRGGQGGPVSAKAQDLGGALLLELRVSRPRGAAPVPPDLGSLALADRRPLLGSVGVHVAVVRRGEEIIVKLRLPCPKPATDRSPTPRP